MLLHAIMTSQANAIRLPHEAPEARELEARGLATIADGIIRPTAQGADEFYRRSWAYVG